MGFIKSLGGMMGISNAEDDEYEDYEDDDNDYVEPEQSKPADDSAKFKTVEKKPQPVAPKRRTLMNDSSVCVFKPKAFDEAREIVETLLENKTVLLNFEGVDISISQRVLDIVTGACIAVNGNLQKISNYIFIATPASVDVSGEFQDTLLGAFDAL